DDEISFGDAFGEVCAVRKAGFCPRFEKCANTFEHFGIAIEDGDVCAEPGCHLRRIEADDAAADDADFPRRYARDAAEEHPAPAMRLFERRRSRLDRHAPCYLAHRL